MTKRTSPDTLRDLVRFMGEGDQDFRLSLMIHAVVAAKGDVKVALTVAREMIRDYGEGDQAIARIEAEGAAEEERPNRMRKPTAPEIRCRP